MDFNNILTEEERLKLNDLKKMVTDNKRELEEYKNALSNMWRVLKRMYKFTEKRIARTDEILKKMAGF